MRDGDFSVNDIAVGSEVKGLKAERKTKTTDVRRYSWSVLRSSQTDVASDGFRKMPRWRVFERV